MKSDEVLFCDRDVRRASAALDRVAGMKVDDARAFDPFADVRRVAGKALFEELSAWKAPAHEAMMREALLRWVHELLQARVGHELACDEREALAAVDEAEPEAARSYEEAWGRLVAEPNPSRALLHLERAAALAAPVAAVRRERRARRFEASRRLGLEHPSALAARMAAAEVTALARAMLDATEPLASQLIRDQRRRTEGTFVVTHGMRIGFADDARDGWPAKLLDRWLREVFGALAPRAFAVPPLSPAVTAASFLRGAHRFGYALRLVGIPRSLPFVLARDPAPIAPHVFGFALGAAMASAPFQRRALGLPNRIARAQARALGVALLWGLRLTCARHVLGAEAEVDREAFAEMGTRLFGLPMPAALRDAWPAAPIDLPARVVGAARAFDFTQDLAARFDEDWFRNPKAGAHLAAVAAGPAWDGEPPVEGVARRIGRAFEESLG